jgi:hypothetical protein
MTNACKSSHKLAIKLSHINEKSSGFTVSCNLTKKFTDIPSSVLELPYFLAHKTHPDLFVGNFRKNNDRRILILVIYWKKTGLLRMKISNHDIIYSS